MAVTDPTWTPSSWRGYPALQQPEWPDAAALDAVRERLSRLPSLIFAGEARALRHALGEAAEGPRVPAPGGRLRRVVPRGVGDRDPGAAQGAAADVGGADLRRDAAGGQGGAHRRASSPSRARLSTEIVDGVELPSFRGHAVHSDEPTLEARTPDPERLVQAYYQAVSSLNLLRAFTKGGFADLTQVHTWNQEFVASSLEGRRYETIANEIGRALRFMQAIGIDLGDERSIHEVDVWTSHEALLLDYEEPLVRKDSTTGDWYACSGHFLWVGERTAATRRRACRVPLGPPQPDRRQGRPVGDARRARRARRAPQPRPLRGAADPNRPPGREPRAGAAAAAAASRARGRDPRRLGLRPDARERLRHGLRPQDAPPRRRHARDRGFFAAHREVGTWPGGVHLEFTGEDVTGVPRRLGGRARGAARHPVRDALRPALERAPVARPGVPGRRADAG